MYVTACPFSGSWIFICWREVGLFERIQAAGGHHRSPESPGGSVADHRALLCLLWTTGLCRDSPFLLGFLPLVPSALRVPPLPALGGASGNQREGKGWDTCRDPGWMSHDKNHDVKDEQKKKAKRIKNPNINCIDIISNKHSFTPRTDLKQS